MSWEDAFAPPEAQDWVHDHNNRVDVVVWEILFANGLLGSVRDELHKPGLIPDADKLAALQAFFGGDPRPVWPGS